MIDPPRVVIPLPELNRPHIRSDEDGRSQDGVQRSRENGRDRRLKEQHGRMRNVERLGECVECRTPSDLPRSDVSYDELHFQVEFVQLVEHDAADEVLDDERVLNVD